MKIETPEDLSNEIADMLGVYGACKHAECGDDCDEESFTCCRVGFMMIVPDRIRASVENEKRLQEVNLKA